MVWILSGYRGTCQWWAGALNQHVDHCSCSPALCSCSLLALWLGECLAECCISLCGLSAPLAEGALQQREARGTGKGKTGRKRQQAVLSCAGSKRIGGNMKHLNESWALWV